MKQLLFLNIIIAALSTSVQAATISVQEATITAYANEFLGSNGSFAQSPTGDPITTELLSSITTSGIDTFVMSNDDGAYFDLGFGSNTATTGAGDDLVIFTIGNGYSFGLQVFDASSSIISSNAYVVPVPSTAYDATAVDSNGDPLCVNDTLPCPAVISATAIDLFSIADDTEIGFIRLWLGNDYNGSVGGETAYPLFSLAGAIHSDAVVVPLPLPAVLFSSGLLLLGWVGRRKNHVI